MPQQCVDGLDNDVDGRVDLADPGCVTVADNDETDPQIVLIPSSSDATPPLLSPFPVVRLRGRIASSGSTISLLSVRAPPGSRVTVTCRGPKGSCPRATWARTTTGSAIRVRAFERRMKSGTVVRIFVTKPGFIGKYTRFTIRRKKAPLRADACSRPNNTSLTCP